MKCELSRETRDRLTSLAYNDWCKVFDNLKEVKQEKDTGIEPDYEKFHKERLARATQVEAQSRRIMDEIKQFSPLLLGE